MKKTRALLLGLYCVLFFLCLGPSARGADCMWLPFLLLALVGSAIQLAGDSFKSRCLGSALVALAICFGVADVFCWQARMTKNWEQRLAIQAANFKGIYGDATVDKNTGAHGAATPMQAASIATASLLGSGLLNRQMVVHSKRTNGEHVVAFYDADHYDETNDRSPGSGPYARVYIKDGLIRLERTGQQPQTALQAAPDEGQIIVLATAWAANRGWPGDRYEVRVGKQGENGRVGLCFEAISGSHAYDFSVVAQGNVIAVSGLE